MGRIIDIAVLVGLATGCRADLAPEAEVERVSLEPVVEVSHPWTVVRRDDRAVVLRRGDGPDGVWIQLADGERTRRPGVTPVRAGEARWVEDDGVQWPLVSPLHEILAAEVLTQGGDVVVRLSGPPVSTVSDHPQAPDDPTLAWVRVRPRAGGWRVVLTGLGVLSWPAGEPLEVETDHAVARGQSSTRGWLSTGPSLEEHNPYPEVGLTLTP